MLLNGSLLTCNVGISLSCVDNILEEGRSHCVRVTYPVQILLECDFSAYKFNACLASAYDVRIHIEIRCTGLELTTGCDSAELAIVESYRYALIRLRLLRCSYLLTIYLVDELFSVVSECCFHCCV